MVLKALETFFFIILGHLLGHKGEHWSLLKKKRKNNKKKTNHSLDGKLVVILEKVGPEKKKHFLGIRLYKSRWIDRVTKNGNEIVGLIIFDHFTGTRSITTFIQFMYIRTITYYSIIEYDILNLFM